jgi:enoyl-CoA hydratase/carnithine racemase
MEKDHILQEVKNRVAYLTLNRPEKLNAISYEMMKGLEESISELSSREDLCAVVIKASGRAFCVGADLTFVLSVLDKPNEIERYIAQINKAFNSLEDCPVPVVAVVQDYALAGGFELIQACDIVIAAETARLGDQHSNYWLIPGGGGTQRLVSLLGPQRAKELLFTGRWLSGKEAEKLGLVSRAVPSEDLESCLGELLENLTQKSPVTLKKMKELANYCFKQDVRKGLEFENAIFLPYLQTPSAKEGLKAFAEKRKPLFDNINL